MNIKSIVFSTVILMLLTLSPKDAAAVVIFADDFDAPDSTVFDDSDQTGRFQAS